jgi:hypothetical protein
VVSRVNHAAVTHFSDSWSWHSIKRLIECFRIKTLRAFCRCDICVHGQRGSPDSVFVADLLSAINSSSSKLKRLQLFFFDMISALSISEEVRVNDCAGD